MKCTRCTQEVDDPAFKRCSQCRAKISKAAKRLRRVDRDTRRMKAAEQMRAWRAGQGPKYAAYQRSYHRKRREQVIQHYGGRCICCGEDQFEFLALDHKNGGGNIHRAEIKARGNTLIGWVIAEGFPDLFEIRCHNCNQARAFYGSCPHERLSVAA